MRVPLGVAGSTQHGTTAKTNRLCQCTCARRPLLDSRSCDQCTCPSALGDGCVMLLHTDQASPSGRRLSRPRNL
ncbi:hypothetical protein BC827DRAFT_821528 [Russula dissimulans]|nr:hypothetical protein BC827DRAFT_821528 [Russula dissimulans]